MKPFIVLPLGWLLLASLLPAHAQRETTPHYVFGAAGDSQRIANGTSHSFSIGEVFVANEVQLGTGAVTQGFLQPQYTLGENMDYYPNPVVSRLFLVNARRGDEIRFYDATGREVRRDTYTGEPLDTELLSGAVYWINVFRNNVRVKSFAIIKR